MNLEYDLCFKLVVLGDPGVGKSNLLMRFSDDLFTGSYMSTIGIDFKSKIINVDGKRIRLQIWDTSGNKRFINIIRDYIKNADGLVLVYEVTNETIFDNIRSWIREIKEVVDDTSKIEMILIGNKCDLSDSRVISKESGKSLADEYGIKYMETSPKARINVEEAFVTLTKAINKQREEDQNQFQTHEGVAHQDS